MGWLWWVGGGLVLGILEMLSLDLVLIMFAGGALAGAAAYARLVEQGRSVHERLVEGRVDLHMLSIVGPTASFAALRAFKLEQWLADERSARIARGLASMCRRPPGCDMIEVRLRTRCGCAIAKVCAIMPPIDAPTTWARSIPRWSSKPATSSAMSSSV